MTFEPDRDLGREYRMCGRLVRVTGHEPRGDWERALVEVLDVHGQDRPRYRVPVTWWQTGLEWGVITEEEP